MTPACRPARANGCGANGGGVSGGIIGAGQGPLLAHEMGHNYARTHVNCDLPVGAVFDAAYPLYLNPSGVAYTVGSTGEVGIDIPATPRSMIRKPSRPDVILW